MAWWGKVLGGSFGFAFGGPLGALLGAAIGHSFDKGLAGLDDLDPAELGRDTERIQAAFFTATFSVMGNLAKADGRVSEDEIQVAQRTMSQMQLDDAQKKAAQALFSQGKAPDFDRQRVLEQLRKECGRRRNLHIIFLEIQITTALADGELHDAELRLLTEVAEYLRISRSEFEALLARASAQRGFSHDQQERPLSTGEKLEKAYRVLGVSPHDSDATIKKTYRRLLSQHHPDKLVSKGLPEEMMQVATEKTREIKEAYEYIKQHRAKH
ncbi:MAG: co-chaperone DjlA [Oleiphilaceae bacterium]|nr:co-chaperone DjlA [Oleiphilaceae bacterium]